MESREQQNPETMKDVAITAPPYKEKPATFFEINPFYVFKAGKHPKETWGFVAFMNGKPFQEGRGRDGHCWPPPAQIPACGATAPGSYLG